jgi:DNA-binding response OmpR family regulator
MSRLLVVEDDPDIALALRLLFSRAGYEVAHAGDGRTGLKEAYAEHPDLVVLDVGLPEMDGWQVLERLRDVSDVPVLVLTAHGQEAEKVRGLRGGADDYLTKPFANNELLARVEALLRRSSSGQNQWASQVYDDGLVHLEALELEVDRDQLADDCLVVDDQHPGHPLRHAPTVTADPPPRGRSPQATPAAALARRPAARPCYPFLR